MPSHQQVGTGEETGCFCGSSGGSGSSNSGSGSNGSSAAAAAADPFRAPALASITQQSLYSVHTFNTKTFPVLNAAAIMAVFLVSGEVLK